MIRPFRSLVIGAAALLFGTTASPAADVGLADLATLQATMQQFVDRKTVDGAYLLFDIKATEVRELYPVTGHPMIMRLGEHFVLCFDFVDGAGKKVEIDYYVARKDDGFVVFHEAVESRAVLEAMARQGRATPIN
jgi:hypothetical protein